MTRSSHGIHSGSIPRRQKNRTFTGCWTCRDRKVKCDEKVPSCSRCQRLRKTCEGYGPRLVWADSFGDSNRSNGRRMLRCDLTWHGYPEIDSDHVDYLIAQCDETEQSCFESQEVDAPNPFSVFATQPTIACITYTPAHSTEMYYPMCDNFTLEATTSSQERMLFHHYIHHVALIMMPFEDKRNPWRYAYPAVASKMASHEQKALFSAILTHSAYNLNHLLGGNQNLKLLAATHYSRAIMHVKSSMRSANPEYGGLQAAIMTLMMAEIYSGYSRQWRTHYQGAWAFLRERSADEPWGVSHFAYTTTQSLYIIKTIGDTSLLDDFNQDYQDLPESRIEDNQVRECITAQPIFGFTVGATRSLLEAISQIRAFSIQLRSGIQLNLSYVVDICRRLEQCNYDCSQSIPWVQNDIGPESASAVPYRHLVVQHHLKAFIAAAYIFLHRALFDAPPEDVRKYVKEAFENVDKFYELQGGNLTVWPAFIAATEAYESHHVDAARKWLERSTQLGMGNRIQVKTVVEEIWRRRSVMAANCTLDLGQCRIDWREVMRDLDIDVLLV